MRDWLLRRNNVIVQFRKKRNGKTPTLLWQLFILLLSPSASSSGPSPQSVPLPPLAPARPPSTCAKPGKPNQDAAPAAAAAVQLTRLSHCTLTLIFKACAF